MSERIDITQIKEKDLRDYWVDVPEVALEVKGSVYSTDDHPFLQLHEFDDSYTIFWLSTPPMCLI